MARKAKAADTENNASNAAEYQEQQVAETRAKLMATIRRIESGAIKVARLSTRALAEAAGVDRTTLYRGYGDVLAEWTSAKRRMLDAAEGKQPAAQVARIRRELDEARADVQRLAEELEVASQQLNFVVQDRDRLANEMDTLKRRKETDDASTRSDPQVRDITSRRPRP